MTISDIKFSVIMTVYDNARELEAKLPAFLAQSYEHDYEVIVVNESSTDDTDDVLKLQKQDDPHLYTTFLPKPNRNITRKRLALTIGVKAAKYEWIIFTDIHSSPSNSLWLKEIADAISSDTEILMGYFRKKEMQLQTYSDIDECRSLIFKTERSGVDGHSGRFCRYLRGKYDFIVVRKDKAHDVLKFYEQDIKFFRRQGLRFNIMLHHIR